MSNDLYIKKPSVSFRWLDRLVSWGEKKRGSERAILDFINLYNVSRRIGNEDDRNKFLQKHFTSENRKSAGEWRIDFAKKAVDALDGFTFDNDKSWAENIRSITPFVKQQGVTYFPGTLLVPGKEDGSLIAKKARVAVFEGEIRIMVDDNGRREVNQEALKEAYRTKGINPREARYQYEVHINKATPIEEVKETPKEKSVETTPEQTREATTAEAPKYLSRDEVAATMREFFRSRRNQEKYGITKGE